MSDQQCYGLEILLLGTGRRTAQLDPTLRTYLRQLGIQTDVMDTASRYPLIYRRVFIYLL